MDSPAYIKLDKEDFLAHLVDNEYHKRRENRMRRFLRDAKVRFPSACLEELDYNSKRGLRKEVIREVASGRYLENKQNVLISGATGAGKTYLASALAGHACRNLNKTRYWRMTRMLEEMRVEKATGDYLKALDKMKKLRVLVIDDLGPEILTGEQKTIMMEIVEDRYLTGSTIIASQLPFEQWYEVFGDQATADAICDRIFHNAIKINLKGDSMRKKS